MVVLLHMELDYMGQDLLWNKTIWKKTILLHKEQDYLKQLSFHMETYYVIKWLFSAAQISEITCFLLSKVIKKQQNRLFFAPPPPPLFTLPPYLSSIYILPPGCLHIVHFFDTKERNSKWQTIEYSKWWKAWVIIDNAASKSMLLLKD